MYKEINKYFLTLLVIISLLITQACSNPKVSGSNTNESTAAAQKENDQETVTITIGYQSPTAQTWGALIIKNQKLYEKYLKQLHPDKNFKIEWFDAPAGSVLNNNMVGGKIQISFLGDMPSLLNGVMGITQKNYRSVFIAFDGKGKNGRNQAILVPKGSDIQDVKDLEGKTVSTPIGSSAHRMLLDALEQNNMVDKVKIIDQSVTLGMQSIEQNKIAAHSSWEPYPSLITKKDIGNVLLSGEETNRDYLAGVVANRDWAEKNKSYVVAFLAALSDAHQLVLDDPEKAAKIFAEESKFPLDITLKMAKNIRFDSAIYQKDLDTLSSSVDFLIRIDKLKEKLNLDEFVDDTYLREAVELLGKNYLDNKELKGDWSKEKVY
ncbi:NitT/TauT family transport system substrate-binding protein [Aeribacillus composti]|uniref:ABC transporter substrate-binding protein n=1 Tax=Aeribacillus composti TaxID=1868734 RepID=UPI00119BAB05|nr:ABC transporter substrate-binding protein [Aeribacillus composti]MED0714737.1 ABC transporter substrate-binding protein [Aeribacillus composti]MED0747418.1 ABC transporter substrate-binding protein [Aeribacillus composti]TVZ81869.1 NitT/TauT family transport system substrate-binding protein [Aeribacillus composti]